MFTIEPDEWLLVCKVKSGDSAAYKKLSMKYAGLCHHVLTTLHIPFDMHDDALNKCFQGFYQGVLDFNPEMGCQFNSFVYVCARRKVITYLEHIQSKRHYPLNHAVSIEVFGSKKDDEELTAFIDAAIDLNFDEFETNHYFEAFINQVPLTVAERQTLLTYISEGSYADTAAALGCNVKRVDNLLTKARQKIRQFNAEHNLKEFNIEPLPSEEK